MPVRVVPAPRAVLPPSLDGAARQRRGGSPLSWPWVLTACLLLLVAGWRAVLQRRRGEVSGLDTGNWYSFGHAWLGQPLPDGAASTYPPLVPVAVTLLGHLADPVIVMIVLGAVSTLVYGACAAVVLWRSGCGWWTPPLAVALAGGSAAGEAVAWGGFPQLLGLGLALLALYLTAELLTVPRRSTASLLGLVLLLLAATSHLVLAETAAAAGVIALLRLTSRVPRPRRAGVSRLVGLLALAGAPSLLLLPLYLRLLEEVGGSFADRESAQPHVEFLLAVNSVTRELPLVLRPLILFSVLLPLALWRERGRPLWLLTAALGVVLTGSALVSPEPRFSYLVPLLLVSALGLLASSISLEGQGGVRVTAAVVGTAACLTAVVAGLSAFPQQLRYYGELVPPGTTAALAVLRSETAPADVVAVPPVRGLPFGWWVEGYGRRPALVASSGDWLNFPRERERAEVSVTLFSRDDIFSDEWFLQARTSGADVVYVPSTYDGLKLSDLARLRERRPDLVLHTDRAATIVEVP